MEELMGWDAHTVCHKAKEKELVAPRAWAGTWVSCEAGTNAKYLMNNGLVRRDVILNDSRLTQKAEGDNHNAEAAGRTMIPLSNWNGYSYYQQQKQEKPSPRCATVARQLLSEQSSAESDQKSKVCRSKMFAHNTRSQGVSKVFGFAKDRQ